MVTVLGAHAKPTATTTYLHQNGAQTLSSVAKCHCWGGMVRERPLFFFVSVSRRPVPFRALVWTQRQCRPLSSHCGYITSVTGHFSLNSHYSAKLILSPAHGFWDHFLCLCCLMCLCTFHTDLQHLSSFNRISIVVFQLSPENAFLHF